MRLRRRRVASRSSWLAAALLACATPSERYDTAAAAFGFAREVVESSAGPSIVYDASAHRTGARLHVYLEGDGLPRRAARFAPPDPTPGDALMLRLISRDPAPAILLGRPCHHGARPCDARHWLDARYGEAVVERLALALAGWRTRHPADEIVLVGHSGGGTLAMLLAERVPDVVAVVTLAGNLDVAAWSGHHGYAPLRGSLDPAARPPLPPGILQLHHLAGHDENVPPALVSRGIARQRGAETRLHPDFDHRCCWQDAWPGILAELDRLLARP